MEGQSCVSGRADVHKNSDTLHYVKTAISCQFAARYLLVQDVV